MRLQSLVFSVLLTCSLLPAQSLLLLMGSSSGGGGGGTGPALVSHVTGPATIPGSGVGGVSNAIDTTGANFLVLVTTNAGTYTVSDSYSNTWHSLTSWSTGGGSVRMWYAWNPTVGTGHTFTVSGTSYFGTFAVEAFSGMVFASDPFDSGTDSGQAATPIQPAVTPGITPSSGHKLVITAVGTVDSDLSTWTINSGFQTPPTDYQQSSSGRNYGFGMSYLIQTTGATVNPTWVSSLGTATTPAIIAAFKGQ